MAGNFNNGGIKGLALAHCEKAVIALAAAACGYLAWQSLGIERWEKEQSELTSLITRAEEAYKRSNWNDSPEEDRRLALPVPSPLIGGESVFTTVFGRPGNGPSRPVLPPIVDREDPPLLPPSGIEATSTTAIFAFIDESVRKQRILDEIRAQQEKDLREKQDRESGNDLTSPSNEEDLSRDEKGRKRRAVTGRGAEAGVDTQGDERFELLSTVCVLAKAPILEQDSLYQEVLQGAQGYDPRRDIPTYTGLYAQRAEVRGPGQELEWVDVRFGGLANPSEARRALSGRSLERMVEDWITWPLTIADQRFVHPVLTMPLAPVVKQNWDADTIHSETPTEAETLLREELEQEDETEDDIDPSGENEFGGDFGRSRLGGGRGGRGGRGDSGRGRFDRESDAGRGGGRGGSRGGGRGGRGSDADFAIDPDVPFVMVRFWDFGVTPGRQYRYRVKLVLDDVNRNPEVKEYLSPEVTKRLEESRSRIRTTEWSEPGPVVSIPLAGDAFVVSAKPAGRGAYSEGEIELLVQSYSLDDGRAIRAAVRKKSRRGSVLSFVEDAEFLAPDGRWIVEQDDFEFQTGLTVADFRGGEELPGRLKSPTRSLLMDPTGKLFVRDELSDHQVIQNHREVFEDAEEASSRGGGSFDTFRGGGGGGGFDERR